MKLRNIVSTYVWAHLQDGYSQGMCDLLAPLLVVLQNEALAYACYLQLMETAVDLFPPNTGMNTMLSNLKALLQVCHDCCLTHLLCFTLLPSLTFSTVLPSLPLTQLLCFICSYSSSLTFSATLPCPHPPSLFHSLALTRPLAFSASLPLTCLLCFTPLPSLTFSASFALTPLTHLFCLTLILTYVYMYLPFFAHDHSPSLLHFSTDT